MTNAEARFNKSLRPRKPEGSLGRTAQDVHLDSHTAPELCNAFWIQQCKIISLPTPCYWVVVRCFSNVFVVFSSRTLAVFFVSGFVLFLAVVWFTLLFTLLLLLFCWHFVVFAV